MPSSVAAVIVGSEVLTAKVQDLNGPLLMERLRQRGIPLVRLTVVHDEVDAIVDAVLAARQIASTVITSGGIGPTHDDVTVRAVALALGRQVTRLPEMLQLLEDRYHDALTPEAMRLADAPEGSRLLTQEGLWLPVMVCDGVYLLPGVPQLFRVQLETVLAQLEGEAVCTRELLLSVGESVIAGVLDRVALDAPDVAIGSYPQFGGEGGYRVKVTVECVDAARVAAAVERLLAELPEGSVLRQG